MNNICIVCDAHSDFRDTYILELIAKGRKLCDQSNGCLSMICVGELSEIETERFFEFGVDYIYLSKTSYLLSGEDIVQAVVEILLQIENLRLVLFPETILGKYVAARISSRVGVGLTAGCIDIKYEADTYIFIRTALNSSVITNIIATNNDFGMCTVKKNAEKIEMFGQKKKGVLVTSDYKNIHVVENRIKIISRTPCERSRYDLEKANVVIGIGRGMRGNRQLELVNQVAKKYGVGIAVTRNLVETGLYSEEQQVGQSGLSISPLLYIAIGISGASQHMIGVRNARTIVAVNIDESAPIFDYADYKIVADGTLLLEKML